MLLGFGLDIPCDEMPYVSARRSYREDVLFGESFVKVDSSSFFSDERAFVPISNVDSCSAYGSSSTISSYVLRLSLFFFFFSFNLAFCFSYSWWSVLILNLSYNEMNSLIRASYFVMKKFSMRLTSSMYACTQSIVSFSESSMVSSISSGIIFWMSFFLSYGTNWFNLENLFSICSFYSCPTSGCEAAC